MVLGCLLLTQLSAQTPLAWMVLGNGRAGAAQEAYLRP
jgi:hypothetical protein